MTFNFFFQLWLNCLDSSLYICDLRVRGIFGQILYKQFGAPCLQLSSLCDFLLIFLVAVIALNSLLWFAKSKNQEFYQLLGALPGSARVCPQTRSQNPRILILLVNFSQESNYSTMGQLSNVNIYAVLGSQFMVDMYGRAYLVGICSAMPEQNWGFQVRFLKLSSIC